MAPQDPYNPARVTYIGETDHRNKRVKFGIRAKDRTRHIYVIGKTGVGKSVLLENMAVQDIQNGEGFAFIDPHGKTADLLLNYIPEHRLNDVLYFAPFDLEHPIAFNVMEDIGPDKRHLVAAGLMSAFKKIWVDAWSARMEYILNNTILALLEYPGSTLLGINRMLADKEYRKLVVSHVTDPGVKSFWEDEFANYTERFAQEATPAIQNKVGQFTANPVIRNIIGQSKSTFNIREMMDQKKILIINLSKGQIGEDSASLLGSMLITKIYLAAMSRADLTEKELNKLPNFYLYVDEFQSFANESFANILSEARKYKLNLTMAHQYIEQMSEEVRAAVFGNVGTMLTFRVGATDAEYLEKEYAPAFTAEDLVNLDKYQVYLKLMIDDIASSPFSARTLPPIELPTVSYRDVAIGRSQEQFARPRQAVEEDIIQWHKKSFDAKRETPRDGGGEGGGRGEAPRRDTGAPRQASGERRPERTERRSEAGNRPPMGNESARRPEGNTPQKKAADREAEVRKAMSLDKLRQENREEQKRAKGPTPQHVAELRDALAAVLGTVPAPAPVQAPQPQPQPKPTPKPQPEKKEQKTENEKGKIEIGGSTSNAEVEPPKPQKEVPEAVLRKLFEREGK